MGIVAVNSELTLNQLKLIIDLFGFDNYKVEVIKMLYPRVIKEDKKNWMILLDGIDSRFTKDDLIRYFQINK